MKKLLDQLKRHEGAIKKNGVHIVYKCPAGKNTVGYGHNLDANPLPYKSIDALRVSGLSDIEADELLARDVESFANALSVRCPAFRKLKALNSPQGEVRAAVLINMAFNLGIPGLLGFKTTLQFVENGEYVLAAENMLKSRWASQVGNRARELSRQMATGEWQF